MANPLPKKSSSSTSSSSHEILRLIVQALKDRGLRSKATIHENTLRVYVIAESGADSQNIFTVVEEEFRNLRSEGCKEVNILIKDRETSKVTNSRKVSLKDSKVDDKKVVSIKTEKKASKDGAQRASHLVSTSNNQKINQKNNISKVLLIAGSVVIGLGVVAAGGSILSFRHNQSALIQDWIQESDSINKDSKEILQMIDNRESLEAIKTDLDSIVWFPGSLYSVAQNEIETIDSDISIITQQISDQSNQQWQRAQSLAEEANTHLAKQSVKTTDLRAGQQNLQEALTLVEVIPEESNVYADAQAAAAEYQSQLAQLDEKLVVEDQASEDYNAALNLAVEASNLTQGSPHTADIWQQAVDKWQASVNHLKAIPTGTSVSADAQGKLSNYQNNLSVVQSRLAAEQKAVQDFASAKQLANEAVGLTQNPPHSSSVWQQAAQKWQQAINLLKGIPNGTTVYEEASSRVATYPNNLSTVNANLNRQLAAEAFERLRPQIQSVVNQFSALDSKLDVGMNYRQYSNELRELKVSLDSLGRQSGARNLAVYKSLENAFRHYDVAKGVWQYYIESDETHNFFRASSPYGSLLISNYGVPTRDIVGTPYIYLDTALSKVWGYAHSQVVNAQNQI